MSLMKQIAEEINAYKTFVGTIVEKIEQFEDEISKEKRLGLTLEASDYYQNGNQQKNDTVDFQPQANVAKPQPTTEPPKGPGDEEQQKPGARIQLMYNPTTGKVENAVKAHGSNPPAPDYMQPDTEQLHAAIQKLNMIDKRLADKIVSGEVSLWIPKNPQAPKQSGMMKPVGQDANKIQMDPSRLAQAQSAASKMSLA